MTSTAKNVVTDLLNRTKSAGRELSDGIESLRQQVAALKEKRLQVALTPVEMEVAFARIDQYVSALATRDRGAANVKDFMGGPNYWSLSRGVPDADIRHFLAPLVGDAMKAQARSLYQDATPITEAEREARIAKIERELLDVEMAEESIIRVAEDGGFPVFRRRNADPRAVLADEEALP